MVHATKLAHWRDIAVIFLATQGLLVGVLVFLALYFALRGLRQFQRQLRPALFQVGLYVWRIGQVSRRATDAVARPFIELHSSVVGLRRTLEAWRGRKGQWQRRERKRLS